MPMIDVYAPQALLPVSEHAELGRRLTHALLRWEGNPIEPPYSEHTAVFMHELPAAAVHSAAESSVAGVRVQVITPPGVLDRRGQMGFVDEATNIVAEIAGDPAITGRTWVILTEASEGGWGVSGFALGAAEFAALRGV